MNLLTTREVMACTGQSRMQIQRLRDRNRFPQPLKLLNSIGYRQDDIERWMRANISAKFHFDDRKSPEPISA